MFTEDKPLDDPTKFRLWETQYPFYYWTPKPMELMGVIAHRRAGKSEGYIVARLVRWCKLPFEFEASPLFQRHCHGLPLSLAILPPQKTQAREIIWNKLDKYFKIFPHVNLNSHRLQVTIPRPKFQDHITISLKAAREYNSVRGERFFEIMADEYQAYPELAL